MKKKKYTVKEDPNALEEAKKYENPIPSRDLILQYLEDQNKPVMRDTIMRALGVSRSEEKSEAVRRRLKAMERDGQLLYYRGGAYGLPIKPKTLDGKVFVNPDGTGHVYFINPDDRVTLSNKQLKGLFHGDELKVNVLPVEGGRQDRCDIVELVKRNTHQLMGNIHYTDDIAYVLPINKHYQHHIVILPDVQDNVKSGQYVLVEITAQPSRYTQPVGRVISVLGDTMTLNMATQMAERSYGLPTYWSSPLLQELDVIPDKVTAAAKKNRKDLTHLSLVTIDGADSKDFDDAVYCEKRAKGGYRLYVAIADVSYYIRPHSALDEEANRRGTSVYFPDSVIPMLPEKISNGLCSLNPKVDRLCMVCEMKVSPAGRLSGYEFYPAVMHSRARLTYDEVNDMLVNKIGKVRKRHQKILPHLEDLYELYEQLLKQREVRGALDFDLPEPEVVLDENKMVANIQSRVRNDAHRLIEECMLLANVATAKFLKKNKVPAPYRVHDAPSETDMHKLRQELGFVGITLAGGLNPKTKDYNDALNEIKADPEHNMLQVKVLRSMNQAVYTPNNKGHFGLAYTAYTHFTSPIRRYPDLLVHRAIKAKLELQSQGGHQYEAAEVADLCLHSSKMERRAEDASRDVINWLKCTYMQTKLGEEFEGRIVNITNFGFFVQLDGLFVDGLVKINTLWDDYYNVDTQRQVLVGERLGYVYKLGDQVQVKLTRVNVDERQIDFELLSLGTEQSKQKKKKITRRKPKTRK